MTLDEAIIHCEEVANDRAGCCEDCAEEHRQLACWLKELKQYKEQTDGDLISRQAVIDLLNRLIEVERKQGTDIMNYGRERVNAYESILDEIESDYLFPSITSAEKTAEWLPNPDDMAGSGYFICSNCENDVYETSDYCPNCGAKMKGVEQ